MGGQFPRTVWKEAAASSMNSQVSTIRLRVLALVARASHDGTPEEEARSCAVIACKLIAEYDLLHALPAPEFVIPPVASRRPPSQPPPPAAHSDSRPGRSRFTKVDGGKDDSVLRIFSKFNGTCCACNERIEAGEQVLWKRGAGVTHDECFEYWDTQ